jgi:hypothetical protein
MLSFGGVKVVESHSSIELNYFKILILLDINEIIWIKLIVNNLRIHYVQTAPPDEVVECQRC